MIHGFQFYALSTKTEEVGRTNLLVANTGETVFESFLNMDKFLRMQ